MALPTASPLSSPSPQVIGNAFVQQYYHILHQSPEIVHKFYQDSSIVSRPNSDGQMTSVTTMQAINDKIMSLDFRNCFTEIETADSVISHQNGVLIVVTGSFTGQDNIRKKFAQSFFLAPQENGGYFVLNDVFRFLNETQSKEMNHMWASSNTDGAPKASQTSEADFTSQEPQPQVSNSPKSDEDDINVEGVLNPSEDHGLSVDDEVSMEPPISADSSDSQLVREAVACGAQDDIPKKSYASIVKVIKGNSSPATHYATRKAKVAASNIEKPVIVTPTPTPETSVPASNNISEKNDNFEEEGYSIYIRNLPSNATAEQVEEQFKIFGPIKPAGVQVRSHKVERYCFGFVEFESLKSMQAAIEASPIIIGGCQALIEEKRTTTRVVNGVVTNSGTGSSGRGRFQLGRGAFRNDNFRGGGFGSNTGYRRNEFRNRLEYSDRGRGSMSQRSDVYMRRNFHSGNGMIGHNGPKPAAVMA